MKKISLIQPSRNNLKYLKWSYEALRKNISKEHQICVADDFSDDGTWEWCVEMMKKDPHFNAIRNDGPTRLGHTILYDRLIKEVAVNDIVMIYHADMYACPDFDVYIDKYIEPQTVVSLTRIEPPLHPRGVEKITEDFGVEPEQFNETNFLRWFNETKSTRTNKTTPGIFAPWAIYKSDFLSVGGHDDLFAPQSKEDSDIFNRFVLNKYKMIQTWEGCVYHMTCRGSRFNPKLTTVGKESSEWLTQNDRSTRNFIRKWGSFVSHDEYMYPVIPPKYNIGFIISNCNPNLLYSLEPWCDTIYVDCDTSEYIKAEQKNTKIDLSSRIKKLDDQKSNNILVSFDGNKLNNINSRIIGQLSEIIKSSGEIGTFELEIFRIEIKSVETYEKQLICHFNS